MKGFIQDSKQTIITYEGLSNNKGYKRMSKSFER